MTSPKQEKAGSAQAGAAQAAGGGLAPELSLVVPLFNEAESLEALVEELIATVEPLGRAYEIILIDDGSSDGTTQALAAIASARPRVKAIHLARNYGQSTAFQAGFDAARGDIVITLDGDLQNDPAAIHGMLDLLEKERVDLVSGWRKDRHDSWLRVKLSQIANALISKVTGMRLHDYGCSLKVYRADLLKQIRVSGELHRFIPVLLAEVGAEVREMPVGHRARKHGRSKYSLDRTLRVLLDLLLLFFLRRYMQRPLHFFGGLGLLLGSLGGLAFLSLLVDKFVFAEDIGDRPLLIVSVTLMLGGLILLTHGVLGEILARLMMGNGETPQYRLKPARKLRGLSKDEKGA